MQEQLSVIIPVYKGEKFLAQLVKELSELRSYLKEVDLGIIMEEVVFVDDCSVDNSRQQLETLIHQFSWIKLIKMKNNSGQHAATVEGMRNCASDWIVTMDEDLQHRPKDIISLWEERNRVKADLVYAVPSGAVHRSIIRNQSSKWIKKLIAKVSSKKEVLYFNSFRLLKRDLAIKSVAQFKKSDYLDMVLIKNTDKISTVSLNLIDVRSRRSEGSGYNFYKLFVHAKRMIFSRLEY